MLKRAICAVAGVVLLTATGPIQAATFELLPTYDTYVSNDPSEGPTTNHRGAPVCTPAMWGVDAGWGS